MTDRRRLLPALLMGVAIVLLTVWYRSLEWENKQVNRGPTQEARQNPVLALQRLLEQREVPVTLVRGFGTLERMELNNTAVSTQDTLVLLNTGRSLRESQVNALWRWMEDGGNLLVAADNPYFDMDNLDDPLLDRLGVKLNYDYWDLVEEEEETDENNNTEASDAETPTTDPDAADVSSAEANAEASETANQVPPKEECDWEYVTRPVQMPGYPDAELAMEFNSGLSFFSDEPAGQILAAYEEQIFLLQQDVGDGAIHLFPTLDPLDNDTIHCADNAFVLWHLMKDSARVWLVLNSDSPSFWHYLWRLSGLGCVLLLAALAIWLWYRVPRFGPVLEPHAQERRQFMDHIHASAQFILRHQGNSALIETLREELWLHLRLRHPGLERLDKAAQVKRIHQFSSMAAADVHLALFRALPVPAPDFVEMVQRLQHLRNVL
jgi:hypothetical protein